MCRSIKLTTKNSPKSFKRKTNKWDVSGCKDESNRSSKSDSGRSCNSVRPCRRVVERALTGVSPAEKVEEEAVVVYFSIRRDREYLRAKHTGQGSIICSSVLGHLAGVGKVGELVSSGSCLTLDALSSGAIGLSTERSCIW